MRPLVRDDRFLAALAVPMSVHSAVGLWQIGAWLWTRFANARWANRLARFERRLRADLRGNGVIALLAVVTSRNFQHRLRAGNAPLPRRTAGWHEGLFP